MKKPQIVHRISALIDAKPKIAGKNECCEILSDHARDEEMRTDHRHSALDKLLKVHGAYMPDELHQTNMVVLGQNAAESYFSRLGGSEPSQIPDSGVVDVQAIPATGAEETRDGRS